MNDCYTDKAVRVRIAPSPTGNCHVGTARNALYNLLFARQRGGTFILRIDDTDTRRSTQASEQGVLEGLTWLGLTWDEGPYHPSKRLDLYRDYARHLLAAGRAYYCFCTPEELNLERQKAQAAGVPYIYSGKCRHLTEDDARRRLCAGEKAVTRFHIDPEPIAYVDLVQGAIEQDGSLIGDPIILKSNGWPAYSFATVVDEIEMQISHVLRGGEHINNTFGQLQMYKALGVEPPAFGHFSLLLNPDRSKISKRAGATYIGEFRDMGYLPETMINHLALSGWNPGTEEEFFTFDDLLARFSLERCSKANAIFDRTRLLWLNGVHIRALDTATLARLVVPYLVDAGLLGSAALSDDEFAHLVQLVALEQERLKTLAEAPDALRFFFQDPAAEACAGLMQNNRFARRHPLDVLRGALNHSAAALKAIDAGHWAVASLEGTLDAQTDRLGWKRADLLMPIRIAISGREATPPLFETMACLGKTATLRRLEAAVSRLPAG